jgi:similar to spore coat protein
MVNILLELAGMGDMTEQVIATDFLISAKAAVQNYGVAISEVTSKEVRSVLRKQLNEAIASHEKIFGYMSRKGYCYIEDPKDQIWADLKAVDTVMRIRV